MKDDYNEQRPTEPIARELHRESKACREGVNDSMEFAKRLRASIEKGHPGKWKANIRDQSAMGRHREIQLKWFVGLSVVAALVLLASLARSSGPTSETLRRQTAKSKGPKIHPAQTLPKADAERGLQLVNSSLGQTIRSVDDARAVFRGMLAPLHSLNLQQVRQLEDSGPQTVRQATRPFFSSEEQLVASITEKVLGLSN